ncbi:MAG: phage tail protein [Flavobacteriaceae bacterium]
MKRYLFLLGLVSFSFFSQAQAIVNGSSIAIQGVLKDNSSNPISSVENIPVTVIVYNYSSDTATATILSKNASVKTDVMGVFSYVLELTASQISSMVQKHAYMKITAEGTTIFDQQLYSVPYSIYAKNGMPTGTIMAYMGDELPPGWLWCDGSSVPNDYFHQNLRQITGGTTPDMRAHFLRGTGTSSRFGRNWSGPGILDKQDDRSENHLHSINITTSEEGNHRHALPRDYGGYDQRDRWHLTTSGNDDEGLTDNDATASGYAGNHTHTVSGNTSYRGGWSRLGNDSQGSGGSGVDWGMRPKNIGVNWIIKI